MALAPKPRKADGYSATHTESCERTLVTLLNAFGTLKDTVRLVGGLVPRYLTPEKNPDVPAHYGTSDVDVVLNLALIAEGEGYASLGEQLEQRGFVRYENDKGWKLAWRWKRAISANEYVLVEFLRGAQESTPGDTIMIDGENVSALAIKHAEITHKWFAETRITANLLDDGGIKIETIRFADTVAFIILKALAFDGRGEPKDAGDLIHVMMYSGEPEHIAAKFLEKIETDEHPQAIIDGLEALQRNFAEGNGVDGYLLTGPVNYAQFMHGTDNEYADERIRDQRIATGLVTRVLELIKVGKTQS